MLKNMILNETVDSTNEENNDLAQVWLKYLTIKHDRISLVSTLSDEDSEAEVDLSFDDPLD